MMTMLVATLGLLPAALSHGIGSDSQRPFAIVIVGGLMADLVMSIFLLPTLYVWIARPTTSCRCRSRRSRKGTSATWRWTPDPVEDVASKPMPVGQRRMIKIVGRVTTHADALHDPPRANVAGPQ